MVLCFHSWICFLPRIRIALNFEKERLAGDVRQILTEQGIRRFLLRRLGRELEGDIAERADALFKPVVVGSQNGVAPHHHDTGVARTFAAPRWLRIQLILPSMVHHSGVQLVSIRAALQNVCESSTCHAARRLRRHLLGTFGVRRSIASLVLLAEEFKQGAAYCSKVARP